MDSGAKNSCHPAPTNPDCLPRLDQLVTSALLAASGAETSCLSAPIVIFLWMRVHVSAGGPQARQTWTQKWHCWYNKRCGKEPLNSLYAFGTAVLARMAAQDLLMGSRESKLSSTARRPKTEHCPGPDPCWHKPVQRVPVGCHTGVSGHRGLRSEPSTTRPNKALGSPLVTRRFQGPPRRHP